MDLTLIIIIIVAAVALVLIVIGLTGGSDTAVDERLARYADSLGGGSAGEPEKKDDDKKDRASPIADYLEKTFSSTDWFANISKDLARADMKLRPTEYIMVMIIASIGLAVILAIVAKSLIAAPIGAVVGVFLPGFYVKQRQSGRLHQFENQLADMLNLAVNSLRAGYSVLQALESVAKEMPQPTSAEIRRVVQEVQIGLTMETALDNLLRRMASPDLKLVVTAMNIQREVGGNLAEILETISHTIRERVRIKGEIRVLTSQQMATGYLVAFLPFGLAIFLYLYNPGYIMRFVDPATQNCGIPMIICGLLLIGSGFFAVQRIVKIEV